MICRSAPRSPAMCRTLEFNVLPSNSVSRGSSCLSERGRDGSQRGCLTFYLQHQTEATAKVMVGHIRQQRTVGDSALAGRTPRQQQPRVGCWKQHDVYYVALQLCCSHPFTSVSCLEHPAILNKLPNIQPSWHSFPLVLFFCRQICFVVHILPLKTVYQKSP